MTPVPFFMRSALSFRDEMRHICPLAQAARMCYICSWFSPILMISAFIKNPHDRKEIGMARNADRDLTQGSPMKLLIGFSLPLLGGFLFQQLYSFVDTAIVGRFLGYDALAAVGSTGSLNFLINGFCMGLCSGFSIPIAQAKGARNATELRRFVMHSVYLCALFSAAMSLFTGFGSPLLLRLMNTQDELMDMAVGYIQPVFFAIPATVLYNMSAGVMRSLGNSRTPMLAIVIAALMNIVLDLLFILVFHMGVAGAAWATIISQLVKGFIGVQQPFKVPLQRRRNSKKIVAQRGGLRGLPVGIAGDDPVLVFLRQDQQAPDERQQPVIDHQQPVPYAHPYNGGDHIVPAAGHVYFSAQFHAQIGNEKLLKV